MSKVVCPEPGSQLTVGSISFGPFAPATITPTLRPLGDADALLLDLVAALDRCNEVISYMTLRCYGVDQPWDGPTYHKEREAARAYLQRTGAMP